MHKLLSLISFTTALLCVVADPGPVLPVPTGGELEDFSCSFDLNNFCKYTPTAGSWTWRLSRKALTGTANAIGPVGDHANIAYYAYLSSGRSARLESPILNENVIGAGNTFKLSFWYFVNVKSADGSLPAPTAQLSVGLLVDGVVTHSWSSQGTERAWRRAEVDLVVPTTGKISIVFDALKSGIEPTGVVAVDEVLFTRRN